MLYLEKVGRGNKHQTNVTLERIGKYLLDDIFEKGKYRMQGNSKGNVDNEMVNERVQGNKAG
ncbi:predicted protein [Sclerotinia sclerotiorum 1980 UF-70]|uniref:Uncharacterized protein n=1 Tax=Sclerotinia sclerotiorum (strain ATCC 18683 / 1980 / Ss-1) TaxID=665079 RepID=A7F7T4_SCLS1|nr:predicted protein [Sclerotinia sclerotiorum 1980 UF-70]EDN98805.1 predicted protein [Sclerotinia sclerotiorum 1980 UF-70]